MNRNEPCYGPRLLAGTGQELLGDPRVKEAYLGTATTAKGAQR